jgi:ribosomal protein L12E/L44/L45/RPP1/RPP2
LTRTTYAGHEIHVLLPLWPPSSSFSSSPSSSDDDDEEEEEEVEDEDDALNAMSQDQTKTPGGSGGPITPPSSPSSSSCPPFGRHMQLHLTYTLDPLAAATSSSSNNRSTTTTSKVLLPPETTPPSLPLTRQTLQHSSLPSPMQDDMLILDYLDKVRDLFLPPYLKRQSVIRALMANFTIIEFDACEYASATILVRIPLPPLAGAKKKKKKKKEEEDEEEEQNEEEHSFLLHFTFPWDFPADRSPPEVSFSDVARARDREVVSRERGVWRYSPRWEGKRMAEALVEHAKGVIRDEYLALIQGIMNMHKRIMSGGGGGGEGGGGGSMLEL